MATTKTYTALEICTAALRKTGVVAIDLDASAEEIDLALISLNMLLKSRQIPALMRWKETVTSVTVTDATATYTLSARPIEIQTVTHKVNDRETWLYAMNRQQYMELPDKTATGTPSQYYYQRLRETGELNVWPVLATGTGTLEVNHRAEIEDITSTTDAVDVPGEWYESIVYDLADRLCDDFPSVGLQRAERISRTAARLRAEAEAGDRPESIFFEPEY